MEPTENENEEPTPLTPDERGRACAEQLQILLRSYRCAIVPTRTVGAGVDELGWRLRVEV